jgi:acetyltransferase-like isoleucine patch superfamily enzyme
MPNAALKLLAKTHATYRRVYARVLMLAYKQLFQRAGSHVVFDPRTSVITYAHTSIGSHVFIGARAWFSGGAKAPIRIGSFVMFGPHVTLLCGDHDIDLLGLPIALISDEEKSPERSKGITIEDDVWIGANATILKGVNIGRGAVVAAGSVVTKHVPPFSVVAGSPARVVRERFSAKDLPEHIRQTDLAMAAKQA